METGMLDLKMGNRAAELKVRPGTFETRESRPFAARKWSF